jgi:hypothetical protein
MKPVLVEQLEDGTAIKQCSVCKIKKPVTDFGILVKAVSGLRYSCKACDHKKHRRLTYNLTDDEYQMLLEEQNNKCAICDITQDEHYIKTKRSLHVDHDHNTGQVRGLLCNPCNRGIGYLKDTYKTVQRAAEYLLRNEVD